MPSRTTAHRITQVSQLAALVGPVGEASITKEADHLHPVYQDWITASPFAVLATSGPGGLDVSPRGDPAPLVRIDSDRRLLLPERRGNNRVDSWRNLLEDPRMALLFFVPGTQETLRVNGRAHISVDPALLRSFSMQGKPPLCVLDIAVEAAFFQCGRALLRSQLWARANSEPPHAVPSPGQMLAALSATDFDGGAYDQALPGRLKSTLY